MVIIYASNYGGGGDKYSDCRHFSKEKTKDFLMIWSETWEEERNKRWPQIYGLSNRKDWVAICWDEDNCGKNRLWMVVGGECKKKCLSLDILNLKFLLYNQVEILGVYYGNMAKKFFLENKVKTKMDWRYQDEIHTHTHTHTHTCVCAHAFKSVQWES